LTGLRHGARVDPIANKNRITVGWGVFFIFLFAYRCGLSVLGELVVLTLTTLGDVDRYHRANFSIAELVQIFSIHDILHFGRLYSTLITQSVGAFIRMFAFDSLILIDIGFQAIAFVGIFKFLMAVEGTTRRYLALLMLSPSFNLWSSIASKEALIVFFVGTLCAYLVRLYQNAFKFGWLEILCAIGVFLFKVHYVPALLVIYLTTVVGKQVKQKAAFVFFAFLSSLVTLYLLRDKVDAMAFSIMPHFLGYGSTRGPYWIEKNDVFFKAPYGMFQAFFGPTLAESASGPIQMVSFLESILIVGILLIVLLRNVSRLPVFSFFAGISSLSWLLFATYPLGIMNAGSAVRYRTGHILLVFFIFAIMFSRDYFVRWREGTDEHHRDTKITPQLKLGA